MRKFELMVQFELLVAQEQATIVEAVVVEQPKQAKPRLAVVAQHLLLQVHL
jgi:hypothetical protein